MRIGTLISAESIEMTVVITQTLLYAATLKLFVKFVKQRFVYILNNIESKLMNFVLYLSFLWFILICIFNFYSIKNPSQISSILIILVISACAILSYKLLYFLVVMNNNVEKLENITKKDTLTNLKNREAFYQDAKKMIEGNKPFVLIFADLDNFKSINDNFGHSAGDEYLVEFAKSVKRKATNYKGFYRISGDEFIFISEIAEIDMFCKSLTDLEFSNNPQGIAFKGLSVGASSFPKDSKSLKELLNLADFNMYQEKKLKHKELE
jgi:diguanylate cyclase (GGDEF)-like protein